MPVTARAEHATTIAGLPKWKVEEEISGELTGTVAWREGWLVDDEPSGSASRGTCEGFVISTLRGGLSRVVRRNLGIERALFMRRCAVTQPFFEQGAACLLQLAARTIDELDEIPWKGHRHARTRVSHTILHTS
jgi:hypothetical protein